jgi:hypothetical protein
MYPYGTMDVNQCLAAVHTLLHQQWENANEVISITYDHFEMLVRRQWDAERPLLPMIVRTVSAPIDWTPVAAPHLVCFQPASPSECPVPPCLSEWCTGNGVIGVFVSAGVATDDDDVAMELESLIGTDWSCVTGSTAETADSATDRLVSGRSDAGSLFGGAPSDASRVLRAREAVHAAIQADEAEGWGWDQE